MGVGHWTSGVCLGFVFARTNAGPSAAQLETPHASTTPAHWEKAFSLAKYNGANVDLGHFVAGNNVSPVPFIKQHHSRITHVHVKDRKMNGGQNFPFGEGDTPIVEVLRLIRDNQWNIQATIEFEYRVPAGSTRMAEIVRAVKYCRDALA